MNQSNSNVIKFPSIEVGQTWVAKDPHNNESDKVKIFYVNEDVIGVETATGRKFNTTKSYMFREFMLAPKELEVML